MRIPDHLKALIDEGIIDEVVRPLMSGKEAQVYLLRAGAELRVAKVYKLAQDRTFKQRAEYAEGRKVRNSRDQRAINNRSRHGREQDEAAWQATEVEVIQRLHAAGVRVPVPHHFIDGVLIMELVTDAEGLPAPRLGDVSLDRESATEIYEQLVREVVRMLCAGIVHGDLSDFNVLLGPEGPVIIDFPQAVNAASNQNARRLLLRDVDNLHRFVARFVPEFRPLPYAEEMWQLYERGELTPDTRLLGRYRQAEHKVDTDAVLGLIADAEWDEYKRRSKQGGNLRGLSNQAPKAPPRSGGGPGHARADARPAPNLRAQPQERARSPLQVQKARALSVHGSGHRVAPPRHAEQGPRRVEQGPRHAEQGPRRAEQGPRHVEQGPRRAEQGPRRVEQGPRRVEQGPRHVEQGPRHVEQGPRYAGQRTAGPARVSPAGHDPRSQPSSRPSQQSTGSVVHDRDGDLAGSGSAPPPKSRKRRRQRRRKRGDRSSAALNPATTAAPNPSSATVPRKPIIV